jgi:ribosomal protein L7/L12
MKLMDRFEQLVVENHKLKEEVDSLKASLSDEYEYVKDLREQRDQFEVKYHDAKCKVEDIQKSLDYYKKLYVARGDELVKLWNRIHDLSAKLANSEEFKNIADRLIENDDPKTYNKIGRIKEFREQTMCGLREAKQAIEAAMERKIEKANQPLPLHVEVEQQIQKELEARGETNG